MKRLLFLLCMGCLTVSLGAQVHYEVFRSDGGYLGVMLGDVDSRDLDRLSLPSETGALITEVVPDSPAAEAGLRKDDVITAVAGLPILSAAQLQRTIRENPAGRTLTLSVVREGQPLELSVTLGKPKGAEFRTLRPRLHELEIPRPEGFRWRRDREGPRMFFFGQGPRLGVNATRLTDQMARFLGVETATGVLVLQVESGTPAEEAGLKAGDVISRVNGRQIESVDDLRDALTDGSQTLEVFRKGQRLELEVVLGEAQSEKEGVRL